ncbi:MAG: hypothetical protein Q8Q09_18625 [Deltaproteobacteria bacterium]|nr:hypothetical protein [Deltaproteobacteria bacterium]
MAQREAFLATFASSNKSAQAFARERKIVPVVFEPVARVELALASGRTLRSQASTEAANLLAILHSVDHSGS